MHTQEDESGRAITALHRSLDKKAEAARETGLRKQFIKQKMEKAPLTSRTIAKERQPTAKRNVNTGAE